MAKILIIEDDSVLAEIYQKKLELDGYEVIVAHDGEEGFEKMKKTRPDLVFLDIMMPKMTGIDVLKLCKADVQLKIIPVVILSNTYSETDVKMFLHLGATGYILKADSSPSLLTDKIRDVLDSKKQPASAT